MSKIDEKYIKELEECLRDFSECWEEEGYIYMRIVERARGLLGKETVGGVE